jgi:hydrogenase expression/formation protein HypE
MAGASTLALEIDEEAIPVREEVNAVCEVLGLDPLYVANEGKLLAAVAAGDEEQVINAMKGHPLGADARVIGRAVSGKSGRVTLTGPLGSGRLLRMPSGEQLPRIC